MKILFSDGNDLSSCNTRLVILLISKEFVEISLLNVFSSGSVSSVFCRDNLNVTWNDFRLIFIVTGNEAFAFWESVSTSSSFNSSVSVGLSNEKIAQFK